MPGFVFVEILKKNFLHSVRKNEQIVASSIVYDFSLKLIAQKSIACNAVTGVHDFPVTALLL